MGFQNCKVVGSTIADFKRRFERFTRLAHRIPLMLAVALDPSVVDGRVDGNTAGGQLWLNAQARTAACRLEELLEFVNADDEEVPRRAAEDGPAPAAVVAADAAVTV